MRVVVGGGRSPSHRSRLLFVTLGGPVKGESEAHLDRPVQSGNFAAPDRFAGERSSLTTGGGCEPERRERTSTGPRKSLERKLTLINRLQAVRQKSMKQSVIAFLPYGLFQLLKVNWNGKPVPLGFARNRLKPRAWINPVQITQQRDSN